MNHAVLIHRKFLPMNQNAPRGCAARGDEVYAEHTARTLYFTTKNVRHDGTERFIYRVINFQTN